MTKRFYIFLALLTLPILCAAQEQKHQFRIGWGDMMYEHAAYYPTAQHVFEHPEYIPEDYRVKEAFGHSYLGHFFAEYQYRLKDFISLGAQLDFSSVSWQSGIFDRYHKCVRNDPDASYNNLAILPTVRVTYLHKGPVSLYSGLGAGMLLSVSDSVEAAFAFNLNLIGVQAGAGHWYGALDLGMMNAFADIKRFYMLGSRLVSVSINYVW